MENKVQYLKLTILPIKEYTVVFLRKVNELGLIQLGRSWRFITTHTKLSRLLLSFSQDSHIIKCDM